LSASRTETETETDPDTATLQHCNTQDATRNKGWAGVHNVAYPIASSAELQLTLLLTCALRGGSNTTAPGASAQGHRHRCNHHCLGSAMLVKEAWTALL
jgi:hypothetical protein